MITFLACACCILGMACGFQWYLLRQKRSWVIAETKDDLVANLRAELKAQIADAERAKTEAEQARDEHKAAHVKAMLGGMLGKHQQHAFAPKAKDFREYLDALPSGTEYIMALELQDGSWLVESRWKRQ